MLLTVTWVSHQHGPSWSILCIQSAELFLENGMQVDLSFLSHVQGLNAPKAHGQGRTVYPRTWLPRYANIIQYDFIKLGGLESKT